MELKEFVNELARIERQIGASASVHITFSTSPADIVAHGFARAAAYENWPHGEAMARTNGSSFEHLLNNIEAEIIANRADADVRVVERLALRIIEITARDGSCTDAALRGAFAFTVDQVTRLGARACAKADDMAKGGPFKIIDAGKPNVPAHGH